MCSRTVKSMEGLAEGGKMENLHKIMDEGPMVKLRKKKRIPHIQGSGGEKNKFNT